MTAQTYAQLREQIAELESQAARLKSQEIAGVVARIRVAITDYGLTPQDLFGAKVKAPEGKAKAKPKAARGSAPKYIDGKGGHWVGRGKRPQWLNDALAAGKKLEDFLAEKFKAAVESFASPPAEVVAPVQTSAPRKNGRKAKAAASGKKAAPAAKFSDGAGNSWSGRGPTPKWLKEAIASGKKKEDSLAKV